MNRVSPKRDNFSKIGSRLMFRSHHSGNSKEKVSSSHSKTSLIREMLLLSTLVLKKALRKRVKEILINRFKEQIKGIRVRLKLIIENHSKMYLNKRKLLW